MTYYVVAQIWKGLNNLYYYAIDYMLETIFLGLYLLFIINYYLVVGGRETNYTQIDESSTETIKERNNLLFLPINSENNIKSVIFNKYTNIQSAENCKGFSETIRQLSYLHNLDDHFYNWFAGVIDGDGNFDLRIINSKLVLKAIRIKLHNRDVRILTRILNTLHIGRIRSDKNKPYSIYIVSTKEEMLFLIKKLNGLIRIKVDGFKKACDYFGINFIEPNYNLEPYDSYFSGLVDTDGTIVFNYTSNRIECNLEFKYNDHTKKLNFENVIPYYKPTVLLRLKKITKKENSQSKQLGNKIYKSIAFKYQTVSGMVYLYNYFLVGKNRLYSDFKFYRVTKIKKFITIRDYKIEPKGSVEFKIYSDFLIDWIQYRNPVWFKVPFVSKIR